MSAGDTQAPEAAPAKDASAEAEPGELVLQIEPPSRLLHTAVSGAQCTGCHSPHKKGVVAEGKELCLRCHAEGGSSKLHIAQGDKSIHSPTRKLDCQDCHEDELTKGHDLLVTKGYAQCVDCHEGVPAEAGHTAVKVGLCDGCHDIHGKDKLLRAQGSALCLRCHGPKGVSKIQIDKRKEGTHRALKSFQCQECHEHNHGKAEKMLVKPPKELCLECHEREEPRAPYAHPPFKRGACLECHVPHQSDVQPLLKLPRDELCFQCHDTQDLLPSPEVHPPVAEGRCVSCHSPHVSENEHLVLEVGKKLCLKCHDSEAPKGKGTPMPHARLDLTKEVVHRAVKMGCHNCHVTTHSGEQPKLLKGQPRQLCYECHDPVDGEKFTHSAVRVGDCPVCHNPHSSDEPALLNAKQGPELCFLCHEDDVTGRATIHKPVREGKCLTCHSPHGSANPFNLLEGRGKQVCYSCHEKVMDTGKNKHKALERYGCTACHDPHGTANPMMLGKPVNQLCTGCHPENADGVHATTIVKGGHVVGGGLDPKREGREFSCASCHNPHGSDNPRFFYMGAPLTMCDWCHGDRTGAHPELKDVIKRYRGAAPAASGPGRVVRGRGTPSSPAAATPAAGPVGAAGPASSPPAPTSSSRSGSGAGPPPIPPTTSTVPP